MCLSAIYMMCIVCPVRSYSIKGELQKNILYTISSIFWGINWFVIDVIHSFKESYLVRSTKFYFLAKIH